MPPAVVRIVTAPDATCGGATWSQAVDLVRSRLARRFGEGVVVEHVTLFTPRFFELPELAALVAAGADLPLVAIGATLVSRGGKLSEPRIAQALRDAGAEEAPKD
jgi:hypothetical protein